MSKLKGERDPDDLAREKIPTRADVPTRYHPYGSMMMVVPLPDQTKVGLIYLPEKAKIQYNEGHIVEFGSVKPTNLEIGDCITWNPQSEFKLEVDDVAFVLLEPVNVIMRISLAELRPTEGVQGDPASKTCKHHRRMDEYCYECSSIMGRGNSEPMNPRRA